MAQASPLHIQLLLHYLSQVDPFAAHEPYHAASRAVREYRDSLISRKLLDVDPDRESGYKVTLLGLAMVNDLCRVMGGRATVESVEATFGEHVNHTQKSLAWQDGWQASERQSSSDDDSGILNPYDEETQSASHSEWDFGRRAREQA